MQRLFAFGKFEINFGKYLKIDILLCYIYVFPNIILIIWNNQ